MLQISSFPIAPPSLLLLCMYPLPLRSIASLSSALAEHCHAMPCDAFALLCRALPCLAVAVLSLSTPLRCCPSPCHAMPLPLLALLNLTMLCPCCVLPCYAMPLPCCSMFPFAMPSPCISWLRYALAVSCHAMPLLSLKCLQAPPLFPPESRKGICPCRCCAIVQAPAASRSLATPSPPAPNHQTSPVWKTPS